PTIATAKGFSDFAPFADTRLVRGSPRLISTMRSRSVRRGDPSLQHDLEAAPHPSPDAPPKKAGASEAQVKDERGLEALNKRGATGAKHDNALTKLVDWTNRQ